MLDFIRIACAVPAVKVGDVVKNTEDICKYIEKADGQNADIVLFPELSMTGLTCGDLFFQNTLHDAVCVGLQEILACSKTHPQLMIVVGLPVRSGTKLYNCAAVMAGGVLAGFVPKTHLTYGEKRWFTSATELENVGMDCTGAEYCSAPLRAKQIFKVAKDAAVGIEICNDLMVPQPCSGALAVNGAEVILNLSASYEVAGKRAYRRELVKHQSDVCDCIYAFTSAGWTESTSDTVCCGQSIIAENGSILSENGKQLDSNYMIVQDCDLGRIRAQRIRGQSLMPMGIGLNSGYMLTEVLKNGLRSDGMLYPVQKLPFIPSTKAQRKEYCTEVFNIQAAGLAQRLRTINANAVIGISGGLDSTLALLVCVEAMRLLGRPVTDIYGVTMPCFGTSDRTYQNAWELMKTLGIHSTEISIKNAVTLHFQDIGHDMGVHNGTFENSQARERTQILMDYASIVNGIVVGTGDLSELALGWCTFNGDHMSMYGVNGSIPKTLIRWIIETVAEDEAFAASRPVLMDILDTPISPELLPPDAQGKIAQQTEDLVGPYALHDFFLYHMLNFGFTPTKIYTLACRAFQDDFEPAIIKKWLRTFYWRFFTQQFKRNCMPDGAKALQISFSPRGDWNMPSDASGRIWLDEIENL